MSIAHARKAAVRSVVDKAIHAALDQAGRRARAPIRVALERLLRQSHVQSTLLRPTWNRPRGTTDATADVLLGLLALAARFKQWIRTPEEWAPEPLNPRPAFSSL